MCRDRVCFFLRNALCMNSESQIIFKFVAFSHRQPCWVQVRLNEVREEGGGGGKICLRVGGGDYMYVCMYVCVCVCKYQ